MLVQLAISICIYLSIAILAYFVSRCLGLSFSPADEPEHHDYVGCYQTWAAHRCCPQGIPRTRGSRAPNSHGEER
jgi:hypothetical protein